MRLRKALEGLGSEERRELRDKLIDHVLSLKSKESYKVPPDLVRLVLFHWQRDGLEADEGLEVLIKTSAAIDTDKTAKILSLIGLSEIGEGLGAEVR